MNHNEATAPHPPTTDTAREIADARVIKMTALKDAVCKCKPGETACVVAVAKAQQEWAAKPTPRPVDGSKLTAEDKAEIAKAFDTVLADYKKCTAIALGTAR